MSMESCIVALSSAAVSGLHLGRPIAAPSRYSVPSSRRSRFSSPGTFTCRCTMQPAPAQSSAQNSLRALSSSGDSRMDSLVRNAAVFLSSSALLLAAGMNVCKPARAEESIAAATAAATVTLDTSTSEATMVNPDDTKATTVNPDDTTLPSEALPDGSKTEGDGSKESRDRLKPRPLSQDEEDKMLEELNQLHASMEKRDMTAAIVLLDKLIERTPYVLEFWYIRGHAYEYMGELDKARKDFEFVLQVEPMSPRAVQGLALVMKKEDKDITPIIRDVQQATMEAYDEGRVGEGRNLRMLLGQLFTLQEDMPQALQTYADLSKDDPTDFRPHLCQGLVRCITGELEQAEKHFAEFRKHCPPKLDCKDMLDDLVSKARREAESFFKKQAEDSVTATAAATVSSTGSSTSS